MGVIRKVLYKVFGPRVPLWEDLRKRRRVDRLRADGTMISAIDSAIATLEFKGLMPPDPLVALEPFGRMGMWKTRDYVQRCQSVDFYEIQPHFADNARKLLPAHVNVHCTDSIDAVCNGRTPRRNYNFVVIDNGLGEMYGNAYCEHFDMLPAIFDIVSSDAVIIANLFRTIEPPSAFDPVYVRRRREFYETNADDAMRPTFEQAVAAYRRRLPPRLKLRDAFSVPHPRHPLIRNNEMHFMVLSLAGEAAN